LEKKNVIEYRFDRFVTEFVHFCYHPIGYLKLIKETRYTKNYSLNLEEQTQNVHLFRSTLIPENCGKQIISVLSISRTDECKRDELKIILERLIVDFEFSMASQDFWRFMQTLFQANGFFELSNSFQILARQKLLWDSSQYKSPVSFLQLIRQNIYDLDLKKAHSNLILLKSSFPISIFLLKRDFNFILSYVNLCLGKATSISIAPLGSKARFKDWKYYISNREIFIIARGPEEKIKIKDRLNSRVIRIFVEEVNWFIDSDLHTCPDVIYCNSVNTSHLMKVVDDSKIHGSDWIIVKGISNVHRKIRHSRSMQLIDSLFLNGTALMVPLILFDILQTKVKCINLTGVTFYASNQLYEAKPALKTPNSLNLESKTFGSALNFYKTLAQHGLLENRNIIRNLYLSRIISFDKEGERIISLTDIDYLKLLDKLGSNRA
jgi:hypothetical protein